VFGLRVCCGGSFVVDLYLEVKFKITCKDVLGVFVLVGRKVLVEFVVVFLSVIVVCEVLENGSDDLVWLSGVLDLVLIYWIWLYLIMFERVVMFFSMLLDSLVYFKIIE